MTAMTGKGAEGNREKFSEIIVSAIDQVSKGNNVDLNDIKIEKQMEVMLKIVNLFKD